MPKQPATIRAEFTHARVLTEHQLRHAGCAGQDPEKHKLNKALVTVFDTCKQHYLSKPEMTGAELFDFVMK